VTINRIGGGDWVVNGGHNAIASEVWAGSNYFEIIIAQVCAQIPLTG